MSAVYEELTKTTKHAKLLFTACVWTLTLLCILALWVLTAPKPKQTIADVLATVDYDDVAHEIEAPQVPSLRHQMPAEESKRCARHPLKFELEFNNVYWQRFRTSNGTFQLFGAYYDIRQGGAKVRILGMIDRSEPKVQTYCQLWYAGQQSPLVVNTTEYQHLWRRRERNNYKQGIYHPILLTCELPKDASSLAPRAVSLVQRDCAAATNSLPVIYNHRANSRKQGFAVCVQGLDLCHGNQLALGRLIEWLELLQLLGVGKVYLYQLQAHPNVTKALKHYVQAGIVQVTPLTFPAGQPDLHMSQHLYLTRKHIQRRKIELISYNDCLYKNLNLFEYVTLLDINDIIQPKSPLQKWSELMAQVLLESLKRMAKGFDAYAFGNNNANFPHSPQHMYHWHKDMPKYRPKLQHVNHTKSAPADYTRGFFSTERVHSLGHRKPPLKCLAGDCQVYCVNTSLAQLQHYRPSRHMVVSSIPPTVYYTTKI